MAWMRRAIRSWKTAARGRRHAPDDVARAVRDITGSTGSMFSRASETAAEHSKSYVESFDRRLPPSLHVSERDRKRANRPIPVVERRLEGWSEKT